MHFGEECCRALAGGLVVSQQEPFIQPAACWLFRGSLLEVEFFNGLREDVEQFGVHSSSGLGSIGSRDGRWVGSSESLAHSSISEAANDMLSPSGSSSEPPKETRLLTSAEGCCLGREKAL